MIDIVKDSILCYDYAKFHEMVDVHKFCPNRQIVEFTLQNLICMKRMKTNIDILSLAISMCDFDLTFEIVAENFRFENNIKG